MPLKLKLPEVPYLMISIISENEDDTFNDSLTDEVIEPVICVSLPNLIPAFVFSTKSKVGIIVVVTVFTKPSPYESLGIPIVEIGSPI